MIYVFLSFFLFAPTCYALSETEFEKLVLQNNAELRSLYEKRNTTASNLEEAELIYGWQFTGGINHRFDKSPSQDQNFTYDSLSTLGLQTGLQKQLSWGLETKLLLETTQTKIASGNDGLATFDSTRWRTQPSLQVRLPLWAGAFGRKLTADYQSLIAQKRIEALNAEIEYDQKFNQAQTLLWSTILQKESLGDQKETLSRIQRIYQVVKSKADRNLEASSNFLQTRSALEQAELNLKNSLLSFSKLERLLKLVLSTESNIAIPNYNFKKFSQASFNDFKTRVTAQEKIISATQDLESNTALSMRENSKSKLDLVGSVALTGDNEKWGTSQSESVSSRYPTTFIGIQWVVPLDRGIVSRSQDRQLAIAKAAQTRKSYYSGVERETLKEDLIYQYNENVEILELNLKLEKTQLAKLQNERSLLNQGRSSIYQVLQFELDLARAQAGKFALAMELEKLSQQLALNKYTSYE